MYSQFQLFILGVISGIAMSYSGMFGYTCGLISGVVISQIEGMAKVKTDVLCLAQMLANRYQG